VQLVGDSELEKLLPARAAVVELMLTGGTNLSERVDAVRRTAENPMSREEVIEKTRDLMVPIIGGANSGTLIAKVMDLESMKNIRELRPLS
jgi:hypothetical protein